MVVGCLLFAICSLFCFICYSSFASCNILLVLFVAYCLTFGIVRGWLFVVCCLLFVFVFVFLFRRVLFVVRCSLLVVRCVRFVVASCCLLVVFRCLMFV